MRERAERTMAAVVDTLVEEMRSPAGEDDLAAVRFYVLATVAGMPDHIRLAFRALAIGFDGTSMIRHGARFDRLEAGRRRDQVERWRRSRIGPKRSWVAFFATFATFGLHSRMCDGGEMPPRDLAA